MKRDNYIGGSISTRIYENNLLTRTDLERLNDYNSVEEVLSALNDSSYKDSIQALGRPEEYEKILDDELKKTYDLIEQTSDNKDILQYFREKYNFHNLKVIAKEIVQKENYVNLYSDIGNIDIAYIKKNFLGDTKEKSFLENVYIEGYEPFDISSNENDQYLDYVAHAIDTFRETNDPKDIDISLDKDYYEKLLKGAKKIGLEDLETYTKERIDLINIKTLMRIKAQGGNPDQLNDALIKGGYIDLGDIKDFYSLDLSQIVEKLSTTRIGKYLTNHFSDNDDINENLLNLEKSIDDHQMQYSKIAKSMTYGPEVLMNYIISKEAEIKNLRIILVSKLNSLPKEFTLERLRETYA